MVEIKFLDIYKINDNCQILKSTILEDLEYIFDNELSNEDIFIYYKKSCETIIIVIYGTSKHVIDMMIPSFKIKNVKQILKYLKNRYETTKEVYDKIKIKYPIQKQISLGHSLGGTLVSHFSCEKSIVYTINKLAIKSDDNHLKELYNFRTYNDIPSILLLLFEKKNTINRSTDINIIEMLDSGENIIENIIEFFRKEHLLEHFKDIKINIP